MLKNTATRYGLPAVFMHWLTALTVFGLFGLGLWMTELTYYDAWYKTAPFIHKSIGLLLAGLTVFRLLWRLANPRPQIAGARWERLAAESAHALLYALLFAVMISGFLISTADGREVSVFGWFAVPALPWALEQQEEIAGKAHETLAFALIGLAVLHVLAALKHHFIDQDDTLRRMLFLSPRRKF